MEKFLIVGLGNHGVIYKKTRHNLGFLVLDKISDKYSFFFKKKELGFISKFNYLNNIIFFLKPTTYVNNSGKSVKYWMIKKNIPIKNILIISDDIYLKFGLIRLRGKGSSGGHNGLKNIEEEIKNSSYARLRIGIKNNFIDNNNKRNKDYVLENWKKEEFGILFYKLETSIKVIFSFVINGLQKTMNLFNGK
ncbi:aminoacyl-tRNA hydrolase [Blattabacterium cuenoti]|uniref:aminoacyl-tRNA hydrolase n=1 Tax=Blattabacterium cuenoti TaxID=1653831 RepID=UPI00163CE685|nr:aminoacyl-tRNA hydrolase [Blattabacterium cuenoti]